MTLSEVRQKYLDFFRKNGHAIVPSSRLVPENDPTTLFTSSGMQPLIPYLLGQPHPQGTRIADSQKSFRAGDIEEVGDNRHTTFFEMLGNWSLGDYFKKEQISWFWQFLTEEIQLDPERIYVTCFIGDPSNNIPKDTESAEIWQSMFAEAGITNGIAEIGSEADGYVRGMKSGERIFFYDAKKNWWSRSGTPDKMPVGEPGGGDTEMFYMFPEIQHNTKYGEHCHPNCDCGRYIELGNSVFMEYMRTADGFVPLPKKNVDYGGGLERITAAANNRSDVFMIDVLQRIIVEIAAGSGKDYNHSEYQASFRVIADHMRAAIFMLGDGVLPSNTDQGYILRRLIRRAVRHMDKLQVQEGTVSRIIDSIIASYKDQYSELSANHSTILMGLLEEEKRFRKTLSEGMRELSKITAKGSVSADDAFVLFTTYGFPFELTEELAKEQGIAINREDFDKAMEKHRQESRAGAAQKFAGGLADHQEQTVKYHTTHHILLKALQMVLGEEVKQRGSNITSERLRIDFSAPRKMTDEEKKRAEDIVNDIISQNLPVTRTVMPREEAEKLGAQMEFGVKYPDMVSVYSVGPKDATQDTPKIPEAFSLEFCGGPHVENTSLIGEGGKKFKILKEEAVAQGVRRIKAVVQ
ncbi:alanine--tRNA ligase [Patescibacteria group bacterium]|nr:alanine--tRNA ligase [Patescibacteria group bacterium]